MWDQVPEVMKRYKIGEVDSFDPRNGQGGVCWGYPKECSLKNSQAKTILWDIWKKRSLTFPQMNNILETFFEVALQKIPVNHCFRYSRLLLVAYTIINSIQCEIP